MVKPGEELFFGGGRRFLLLAVVAIDDDESPLVGLLSRACLRRGGSPQRSLAGRKRPHFWLAAPSVKSRPLNLQPEMKFGWVLPEVAGVSPAAQPAKNAEMRR